MKLLWLIGGCKNVGNNERRMTLPYATLRNISGYFVANHVANYLVQAVVTKLIVKVVVGFVS